MKLNFDFQMGSVCLYGKRYNGNDQITSERGTFAPLPVPAGAHETGASHQYDNA